MSLSYGAELTHPLKPALVNAMLNFLGQVCAFVMTGASTIITDVDATKQDTSEDRMERRSSSMIVIYILGGSSLATFILAYFVKEDLRRVNFKQQLQTE